MLSQKDFSASHYFCCGLQGSTWSAEWSRGSASGLCGTYVWIRFENTVSTITFPVLCRGPRGVLTGGGDLPPGYLETYEEVKPPPKPDVHTSRQQPDLPDFAGGGAPDPRVDNERYAYCNLSLPPHFSHPRGGASQGPIKNVACDMWHVGFLLSHPQGCSS